jgi:hypothetical protein
METTAKSQSSRKEVLLAHESHQYLFFLLIDIYQWSGKRIRWDSFGKDDLDLWFAKWNAIVDLVTSSRETTAVQN